DRRDDLHVRVHVLPRLGQRGSVERVPELWWWLRTAARPARARVDRGRDTRLPSLDERGPQAGRPIGSRGTGRVDRRAVTLGALTPYPAGEGSAAGMEG